MAYKRKTVDEFQVHADYGQGWEEVTAEVTRKAANDNLREYRTNAPEYRYKLVVKRVRIGCN